MGTPAFTGAPGFTAGTKFSEKIIGYDANGNITGLQRTNFSGTLSDDFSKYGYNTNTNQLNSVGNTAGSTVYGTYTYDAIGRLKTQTRAGTTYYLQYDVTGKITAIYNNAAMTAAYLVESYTYDESGNRITKTNASGTTYYVYDASGNVLAIYNGATPALAEVPIYGSGRLGTYFTTGSLYVYEIRDNVGSVRVAFTGTKTTGGQANIYNYSDFYPYGSLAQSAGTNYRYAYQGAYAESDPVTSYDNFALRMYDGRIGRWLSVDPAGQFASPYEGMGNDPVTGNDPTGGFDDIDINSKTGQQTITTTSDDFNRYSIDGKYQGWAFKDSGGGLAWIFPGVVINGGLNPSNVLSEVTIEGTRTNNGNLGSWFKNNLFGGTIKVKNGYTFVDIKSDYLDNYNLRAYKSTTTGKKRLFNVNSTTYIDQYGNKSSTTEYELNLVVYKVSLNPTDSGVKTQIGIGDYFSTSAGLSVAKGFSYSGNIGNYGVDASARAGGGTLAVAALIMMGPEAWAAVATAYEATQTTIPVF